MKDRKVKIFLSTMMILKKSIEEHLQKNKILLNNKYALFGSNQKLF
jgi:hypothetical protein